MLKWFVRNPIPVGAAIGIVLGVLTISSAPSCCIPPHARRPTAQAPFATTTDQNIACIRDYYRAHDETHASNVRNTETINAAVYICGILYPAPRTIR